MHIYIHNESKQEKNRKNLQSKINNLFKESRVCQMCQPF